MTEEQTLVMETEQNLCVHPDLTMLYAPPNGRWICTTCGEIYEINFSDELAE